MGETRAVVLTVHTPPFSGILGSGPFHGVVSEGKMHPDV